jgi:mono/diheme cytochrome c family protein
MHRFHLQAVATLVMAGLFQLPQSTPARGEDLPPKVRENYQSYCVKCHGEQGKGDGPGSALLKPKPRDFADCANMLKRKDDELFKVISEGGESIGMSADMQEWGGTLSEAEIHDLVKFVRTFCKQP